MFIFLSVRGQSDAGMLNVMQYISCAGAPVVTFYVDAQTNKFYLDIINKKLI